LLKILVTCTQAPYNGGASTNSYALIKYLRKLGYRACGIFYVSSSGAKADPDKIGGVFACNERLGSDIKLCKNKCKKYLGGEPSLVLSKNYVAPIISKNMFPESSHTYMVSGAPIMMDLSKHGISAVKYLKNNLNIRLGSSYDGYMHRRELECVDKIDNFLLNSKILKDMFVKTYGNRIDGSKKLTTINTSCILNNLNNKINKSIDSRPIDILFASSRLNRLVKNFHFAQRIFESKAISNMRLNIVIVGDSYGTQKLRHPNIKYMSKQRHKPLMNIMSNSKIVLCTSYFDASPNLLSEAIQNGCNFLTSKNCGWSEEYPKEVVCDDVYDIKEWTDKIKYLLKNKVSVDIDSDCQIESFKSFLESFR
jgi:glycosyltransferase involved in cell wall biosynthesis